MVKSIYLKVRPQKLDLSVLAQIFNQLNRLKRISGPNAGITNSSDKAWYLKRHHQFVPVKLAEGELGDFVKKYELNLNDLKTVKGGNQLDLQALAEASYQELDNTKSFVFPASRVKAEPNQTLEESILNTIHEMEEDPNNSIAVDQAEHEEDELFDISEAVQVNAGARARGFSFLDKQNESVSNISRSLLDTGELDSAFYDPPVIKPRTDIPDSKSNSVERSSSETRTEVPVMPVKTNLQLKLDASQAIPTWKKGSSLEAISMINSYQKVFPRKIFVYGQKEYKISELKTYCIGIQTVTIGGKGHNLPVYVDTQVGVRKRHFPQGISRHRPRRSSYRGKRSTWDYITSGWIFSSKYFDDALKHEHDLEASDITLVKDALQKDTKILLSLQADKTEKDNFQKSVCSLTDTISKKIILDEFNSAQQTLLLKAESLLRQCSSGLVPDILTNEHLRKLCASVSESEYCLGHEVRALFRCETIQPSISVENVGVNLELELSIPIEEHYESSFIHSIGVPFRSNAIDVQRNVSSLIQKNKPLKSEPEPRSNDINEALKQIFKKLSEKRKKREIVNSYHFLKVKNLPEILVTHERDMLAFDKTDCRYDPRSQFLTCDYSLVKQSEIECIKSMTLGNVNRIEHFCEIDLISSNYPCDNIVVDGIGYLVSTHVDIPIQATSNSKVFISQNVLNTCKKVCAILISGDQKSFSCGNRNFILEPSQTDEVNFAATQIDNIDLRKLGLTRKHDIRQLELSGFDLLDSSLTEHDVSRIATISGTFSLIGMCFVILIFVIRFWSCIYTKAKSCYSRCCKRTVKVEQIPFIGTDRLTRSRKLNSRYTK